MTPLMPKMPKSEPHPCVYCGKPAPFFAPLPKHVKCPECCAHPERTPFKPGEIPRHVIAVQQPVCAECHPEKEYMKTELRYQEEEAERQKVWDARELMMFEIFGKSNSPDGATVVAMNKYGCDIAAKAWGELQSEFIPMARVEE